ncbi:GNAT family protein [Streptomyces sp. NPDC006341]
MRLRPFQEGDLGVLERLAYDPQMLGPLAWTGWSEARAGLRKRWEQNRLLTDDEGVLAVVRGDAAVGAVTWRAVRYNAVSRCWNTGICLLPEERGTGGAVAAGLELRDYLFAHTQANRIEAHVDVDNTATRVVCEKIGMTLEGVARGAHWRAGRWRDAAVYAYLRGDLPPQAADAGQPA